jgi:hypothetical protein
MELLHAFAILSEDQEQAERFSKAPEETLQSLGVDTKGLRIEQATANPEQVSGQALTVCASIGVVLCASVGS